MAGLKGVHQRPHFNPPPRDTSTWQERAACVGLPSEFFYPDKAINVTAGARRVCADCPVRTACLEHALAKGEWHGTWGGLTPEQRRELARGRRDADRLVRVPAAGKRVGA